MGNEAHDWWIGVDLDGTLAIYDKWVACDHVGAPIPLMVNRVKAWLAEGRNVRIVTARVYAPMNNARRQLEAAKAMIAIQDWCHLHLGQHLPVTCTKDYAMIELWDDRAVQVIRNEGLTVEDWAKASIDKLKMEVDNGSKEVPGKS